MVREGLLYILNMLVLTFSKVSPSALTDDKCSSMQSHTMIILILIHVIQHIEECQTNTIKILIQRYINMSKTALKGQQLQGSDHNHIYMNLYMNIQEQLSLSQRHSLCIKHTILGNKHSTLNMMNACEAP